MVFQLDNDLWFPDPHNGESDGLIAVGGDLSVDRLLLAYSYGIFPWFSFRDWKEPMWYCPMQRFVIFPSEIHISHSMRTLINKEIYHCSMGRDFEGVINGCAENRKDLPGAWLGDDMIEAYTELHRQGFAQSVEVWKGEELVGGLYGVAFGRCFFGESMFSRVASGSKIALIYLSKFMQERGGLLIDCQFETPHLRTMGGRFIDYDEYMRLLKAGLK